MSDTSIEWTDKTWNPTRGCSRISPGCKNCYAERFAARFSGPGKPFEGLVRRGKNGPRWTGVLQFAEDNLETPIHWRKPARIFVNSMSDLFHEEVPDEFIDRVFAVMASCQHHTFQLLTKRPDRMLDWFKGAEERVRDACRDMGIGQPPSWPLPNLWIGVSVEDQQRAVERIPVLLQIPAVLRFLSCEPLLSRVCLLSVVLPPGTPAVDWVIVGGESGPGARPCDLGWIEKIVKDCDAFGVPVFVKQLGSFPISNKIRFRTSTPKGNDVGDFPWNIKRRSYPCPTSTT